MLIKTDGLVIREQAIGEQDRIVTVLTRKKGVIRAFANGVRSPKNKNVSATGLLCYSDFSIDKTAKGAYIIREALAKEVFFSLREDIIRLSLAQYFAEIAGELSPREEDAGEFLRLVLNSIYLISKGKKNLGVIKAATELRLLSISGYMPSVVACDSCGCYESQKMYFSTFTGKLWCENCVPQENAVTVSISVVAAIRHICFSDAEKIYSFNLPKDTLKALCAVSEKYLKSVTMRNYKTLDFYKMMTEE
ncbi:MAG: DNA repair protein RecO [Acutalibacteraceae bacterium]